jgi:hypothetical protein
VVDVDEREAQVLPSGHAVQLAQQAGAVHQTRQRVAEGEPVDLLEMLQVAEAGREVRGEHFEQLVVDVVEARRRGDIDRRLALPRRQVEHAVVVAVDVLVIAQRACDRRHHGFRVEVGERLPHRGGERSRGTDHVEPVVVRIERRAALRADDAVDGAAQQRARLREHAFGEIGQGLWLQQAGRGADDQLEAAAALVDGADLLVALHRRGDGGDQARA